MKDAWRRSPSGRLRARGAGVPFRGEPGEHNAITDVASVEVGYTTLISGEGALKVGEGPVRTGVTAILPRGLECAESGVFAAMFSLNGNGEMSGAHWIEETGRLDGPITITNTHSCGLARDATIKWLNRRQDSFGREGNDFWMPVAAETCDSFLNDMNGFHVKDEHVFAAIEAAKGGPIAEGSVGGGAGMSCYQFKAGSGAASRKVQVSGGDFTIGAFVQANFGARHLCTIAGVPIGEYIPYTGPQKHRYLRDQAVDSGSIIIVLATDAPLHPLQLKRLARRAGVGMARSGGIASNESGDIFLAFSTANRAAYENVYACGQMECFGDFMMTPMMEAAVQAVDEAILNSLFASETMVGRDGNVRDGLPVEQVRALLRQHGRWIDPDA